MIDILADDSIKILIPVTNRYGVRQSASDCKLKPNESKDIIGVFIFNKPFGNEMFKLVASSKPLNLDPIIRKSGQIRDRSVFEDFELLFADSFDMLTRNKSPQLPPESIYTHSLVFEVLPKK